MRRRRPSRAQRGLRSENFEAFPIDGDRIFREGDVIREIAQDRIVFQQMRERLRIRDVVDRDNLDRGIAEHGAKDIFSDASKSVDAYFHGHASSGRISETMCLRKESAGFSVSSDARARTEKSQRG